MNKEQNKSKVYWTIKLKKNGETVLSTTRRLKSENFVWSQIKVSFKTKDLEWDEGYWKITYDKSRDYYNHGHFKDLVELKELILSDTEKDLLLGFVQEYPV